MKTEKIYLLEFFFLFFFQSKEMLAVKLLNEKNSVCQRSSQQRKHVHLQYCLTISIVSDRMKWVFE